MNDCTGKPLAKVIPLRAFTGSAGDLRQPVCPCGGPPAQICKSCGQLSCPRIVCLGDRCCSAPRLEIFTLEKWRALLARETGT